MTIALMILGIFIGGSLYGFPGTLLGGVLGYLVASLIALHNRLHDLEKTVAELRMQRTRHATGFYEKRVMPEEPGSGESPPVEASQPVPPSDSFAFREKTAETVPDWSAVPGKEHIVEVPEPEPVPGETSASSNHLLAVVNRFLTGGSLLVKVGVIILFFGVSFLVKYAAEHALFPIELRLAAAACGGFALLAIGWRLRLRREQYAQILQGGGIGILYLTTFAALRLYALIPPTFAFAFLVAVALVSSVLAVLQDACPLALLGVTGGFLAPVLASTGSGSHIVLFSYYALLNAGIIGIAWYRAWRILNLVGFVFTFIIGLTWGYRYYQPEYFATTEPFLFLFFGIYVAIAILFALRQEPQLKGYLDGTLVFGTPVVTFALQAMLVRPYRYGLAWSALALALVYLSLAWLLFRRQLNSLRTLVEAFFAFGVVFATLTIPLALDNRWTSAAWALEGAGIIWAGIRQGKKTARLFGMLLLFGAGAFFLRTGRASDILLPVLNGWFLGCALLAIAGLFSSLCLYRHQNDLARWEMIVGIVLFVWGLLWWFGGGLGEIDRYIPKDYRMGGILVFVALSCAACGHLERQLDWPWLSWPALGLLPLLIFPAMAAVDTGLHPFAQGGFVAWPLAFSVLYRILRHHETIPGELLKLLHAGALWLITGLLALEINWQLELWIEGADTWPLLAWGGVPAVVILFIAVGEEKLSWPLARHLRTYLGIAAGPIAILAWLWTLSVNMHSAGDSDPLPYLPVLNPLDVTIGFVFYVLLVWFRRLSHAMPDTFSSRQTRSLAAVYAASLFIWSNAILVRTIHQWGGVEFSFFPLFQSVLLQASLSIFWSLLALCAMLVATRKGWRVVWLSGAGLLAAVVGKLFLVDLSGTGTVERIVSFVGVGILLLIVGYVSPVPPHREEGGKDVTDENGNIHV